MEKFSKKWRKLPLLEKTSLLISHYGIKNEEIERIRRIESGTDRLIKAAKLQYELFHNIHNDVTAWIAGYSSEGAVRSKLGTHNLRDKFIRNNLSKSVLSYSYCDYRRNIKIPKDMTEDLAEETGIHIGDGCLSILRNKQWFSPNYRIDGHLIDELSYHQDFILPTMKKLYNIVGFTSIYKEKNGMAQNFKSKVLLEFKNKILGMPVGSKQNINIPKEIIGTPEFERRCLIGIMDTDFTLNKNMQIVGSLTSLKIIKEMDNILLRNNIQHSVNIIKNLGYLRISHVGSLKIVEEWGMHNPKHLSKYELWKEYGVILPFTRTPERLAVLGGHMDIEALKKISKKRQLEKAEKTPRVGVSRTR